MNEGGDLLRAQLVPGDRAVIRKTSTDFHRRGHHVQKAHGRRITLAADNDHTSGGMIALMPTAADAKRLALKGGEAAPELHCTLFFLGDDGPAWDEDQRNELEALVRSRADELPPVKARVFGVAHWNGDAEKPSWVWSVGDDPEAGPADSSLNEARYVAQDALESTHERPEIPHQHTPWVAHICAAYTDDLTLVRELEKRIGNVTFDRIRLSFGDDDRDIPLEGMAVNMTASGLRRDVMPHEEGTDFAEHNRQWEGAVTATTGRLNTELSGWRAQVREQIIAGADTPEELTGITVDTEGAADILRDAMTSLAERAGKSLQREAERQGVTVPEWTLPDDTVTAAVGGRRLLDSVARMTADLMATSVVQTAKRVVTGLFTRDATPEALAAEVDRVLTEGQDGLIKSQIGTAMSTAQTAGRQAVLEVAPPGEYYASEILDRNTCAPCKAVDGEQFGDLERAIKAYPVMGYKDCVGPRYGNSCRGMIVARWTPEDEVQTASAVTLLPETGATGEGVMTDHYGPSNSVSSDPWNGAASAFSDDQYKRSCAACDPGSGTPKEKCFLPHHNPGGALNRAGLGAAAGRIGALSGHSPEAVARAKAHLRGHYRALGEDAPDSLQATSEEVERFGVERDYRMTTFTRSDDVTTQTEALKKGDPNQGTKKDKRLKENQYADMKNDCPPGMEPDQQTGKCVDMAAGTQALEIQGPAPEDIGGENTAPWRGPLTVEGIETGDGREFDTESLTWADLPLPLRWNKEDSHGGEPHTVAVNVGRIDKIWREDSGLIMGEGLLDLSDDDGQKVHAKIKGKFLRGVSVDVDSVKGTDMELVWPDQPDGEGDDPDPFMQLFAEPEKVVFHKGRIRAATLVDIPAFAEAYIALLDEAGAIVAGGEPIGALRAAQAPRHRSFAVEVPVRPPVDWFSNPDLSVPTGITVTADGRVYGHAALWGTCHIGQAGVCVTPPREDDHPYFMTGNVWTDTDASVSVGQITVGTNHAPLTAGHRAASDHYDNTGAAVADVAVGNDRHGIWVAGAIRPGASAARIHELRAAGQVSGDWRRIGGALRLVGLLAVNVPGFPVPKLRTHMANGQQLALVASGIPALTDTMSEDELDQWALRRVLKSMSRRVNEE